MSRLLWSFGAKRYPSRSAFNQAVMDYHLRIGKTPDGYWNPDELVLPIAEIEVAYQAVRGNVYGEAQVFPLRNNAALRAHAANRAAGALTCVRRPRDGGRAAPGSRHATR
jgi:hypothetical protein